MNSPNRNGGASPLSYKSLPPGYLRTPRWNQVCLGAIACGFWSASVQAGVIVSTSGSSDPTAAGFQTVFSAGPPTVTAGPGTDTEAYWSLHTGPFPGDSGGGHYAYFFSPADY